MKKLIIIAATAFLGVSSLCAQENYNGSGSDNSLYIHPDRRVTLRLKAPAGHKVSAFTTFVPGSWAEMNYNDSLKLYEFTTAEPVEPTLQTYKFFMDGVGFTDPENIHTIRDVSWQNNFFLPKGDGTDQATMMSVNHVPHGSVTTVWYDSKSEGRQRRMNVYLPADYYTNTKHKYPVFYLLHGMGGDETAWLNLGRLPQIMDNLIASGKAEPMIVVMPNGVIDVDAAAGCGEEGLIQPKSEFPRLYTGEYEIAFPEIVNFIDKAFRTIPNKAHRAIAGLSMGGYHTANISREYPDMFNYVGLFSAATPDWLTESPQLEHLLPVDKRSNQIFLDTDNKLKRQFKNAPALYWIAIGSDDFLYKQNATYRAHLDSLGLPYTYVESDGGHTWVNWRNYLMTFAPMLFK
jgi:enterochelin esterase family protein